MKQGKVKQLRDFIKSHEKRYFVEYSDYSGQTNIKKAFKWLEKNIAEATGIDSYAITESFKQAMEE